MKLPYMADQCEQMLKISSEFVRLQVSHDEYLCMKVLLLLSTGQNHATPTLLVHVHVLISNKANILVQYCPLMLQR